MKYFPLVWAGIWRKPARTIFTLLSVIVAFILFGVLMGFNHTIDRFIDQARLDRVLFNPRYGGFIPRATVNEIAHLPGVKVVTANAGVFGTYRDPPNNNLFVLMVDENFEKVRPEHTATAEQMATLRGLRTGALVTELMAARWGWKIGDRVALETPAPPMQRRDGAKAWTFDIVGIIPDQMGATNGAMFGNYAYLDEARVQNKGTVGFGSFLVNDPAHADEIAHAIDRRYANSGVPMRSIVERQAAINGIEGTINLKFVTITVVGAALFMVLFLTGNVLSQSVRERLNEFAVLKTLGYPDHAVTGVVLAEAILPCIAAALLGMAAAYAIQREGIHLMPPGVAVPLPEITPIVVVYAVCLALLVAGVSSWPAIRRLANLPLVDALAGR